MVTRLLLVDGFNLIRRIYEARRETSDLDDIVKACGHSMGRALREHRPTHACVVLDSHDRTWRHLLYEEYKGNRKPTPAPLMDNLASFDAEFRALGVPSVKIQNYEADDVIATLAVGVANSGGDSVILSTDRMFLQLAGDRIRIFNHFDHVETTPADVRQRYGVGVEQLIDYWALAGDSSNNIKGVPGVGPKTAASLLSRYPDLESIIASEEKVSGYTDTVKRCKQLVTLKTDVALGINLRDLRYDDGQ